MTKELDKRIPADIEVVTLDLSRKRGGDYLVLKNCVQTGRDKGEKAETNTDKKEKNPSHSRNFTRNVKVNGGRIRKINILLVKKFNGKEVIP